MSEDDDPAEAAQLDLATAFFAVLLLYLVLLLTLAAARGEGETDDPYRLIDPQAPDISLRLYRDVYPLRTYWIVQGDIFAEVDLERITRDVLAAEGRTSPIAISYSDGTDVRLTFGAPFGPGGFSLAIERHIGRPPSPDTGGPWRRVLDGTGFLAAPPSDAATLFLHPEELLTTHKTLTALRTDGHRPALRVERATDARTWIVVVERRPEGFELETIFR